MYMYIGYGTLRNPANKSNVIQLELIHGLVIGSSKLKRERIHSRKILFTSI